MYCDCPHSNEYSIVKGKILGSRYKIVEYLAEGGFGRTYLAKDIQLPGKDICVVKQLYPSSQSQQFLAVARRMFETEASTLHNLGGHDRIPELLAYFEQEEKFYLVQQYIKGKTLSTELNYGQIWTQKQVIELLRDGLNILQFVHAKGVIHRDIKPDNLIRRDRDGKLVLVDFGTVKQVLQGEKTDAGQLTVPVGTQGYMSTEQARGKPRPNSDLYALGMIAIEALTGIAPLDLEEDEEGEIIWDSTNISPELAAVLFKMTRYHFKDRYQSATEVLQALDKIGKVTKLQTVTAVDPDTVISPDNENKVGVAAGSSNNSLAAISVLNNTNSGSAIAPNNRLSATVDNGSYRLQSADKLPKKGNAGLIVTAIVLIACIGAYLTVQQIFSKPDIPADYNNLPANKDPSNPNPTPRIKQGDGFRKDL